MYENPIFFSTPTIEQPLLRGSEVFLIKLTSIIRAILIKYSLSPALAFAIGYLFVGVIY